MDRRGGRLGHPPARLRGRRVGRAVGRRAVPGPRDAGRAARAGRGPAVGAHPVVARVTAADGSTSAVDCFPCRSQRSRGSTSSWRRSIPTPDVVAGRASLYDVTLLRVPAPHGHRRLAARGHHRAPLARRRVDARRRARPPLRHRVPGGARAVDGRRRRVRRRAARARATPRYYVPYDGVERPLPGVWVGGSDGARLRDLPLLGQAGPGAAHRARRGARRPRTTWWASCRGPTTRR